MVCLCASCCLIGRQVVKHCSIDPWLIVCSYLIGRAEHCSVVPGLVCVLACLVKLDPKRSKLWLCYFGKHSSVAMLVLSPWSWENVGSAAVLAFGHRVWWLAQQLDRVVILPGVGKWWVSCCARIWTLGMMACTPACPPAGSCAHHIAMLFHGLFCEFAFDWSSWTLNKASCDYDVLRSIALSLCLWSGSWFDIWL